MKVINDTKLSDYAFRGSIAEKVKNLSYSELCAIDKAISEKYPDGVSELDLEDLFRFNFDEICAIINSTENESIWDAIMKTKKPDDDPNDNKTGKPRYSRGFKEEALKLSDRIGVKETAEQLDLNYNTLTDWRRGRKLNFITAEEQLMVKICKLEQENEELKKTNEILLNALTFLEKLGMTG